MKHLVLLSSLFLLPAALLAQTPVPPQPIAPVPVPNQPLRMPPQMPPQRVRVSNGNSTVETLPNNYQLALTISEKDAPPIEVTLLVASSRFTAALGEQGLNFQGYMTMDEAGELIVDYSVSWSTPVANTERTTAMSGSVRVKSGQEVQIIRVGGRSARLTVTKVETPAK